MANELEKQTEELKRQTKAVSEMTDQIKEFGTGLVVSQTALARTYQQELSGVSNQLNQGFSGVSRELGQMSSAFSFGLNRVSNGFNVMAQSLKFMSDATCKRLDALHNIANNPLLTQAQELYRLALVNYNKGFFEEALDDVKQAIEKYKTDYMSWFLMGHIYAFGEGEFSNVKNLEQAINAFSQSAKYNSPNVAASKDARLLAAEIYFYWGTAQYLQWNALLQTGKKEEAAEMLEKALASYEKSFQYSCNMLEALRNSARCKVKLNQKNTAILDLENLFLRDRNYYDITKNDNDFTVIRNEIEALIIRMRHRVFIEAEPKYKKIQSLVDECRTLNISTYSYGVPSQFTEELPYFEVLDYNDRFEIMILQIEAKIRETIEQNRRAEQERKEKERRAEQERIEKVEKERREGQELIRWAKYAEERVKEERRLKIRKIIAVVSIILYAVFLWIGVFACPDISITRSVKNIAGQIISTLIFLIPFAVIFFSDDTVKRVISLVVTIGLCLYFLFTGASSLTCHSEEVPFAISAIICNGASCVMAMIFPFWRDS
jgi:tetratricopeptide (TPR) repeat protein